jgi:hypothetical protein
MHKPRNVIGQYTLRVHKALIKSDSVLDSTKQRNFKRSDEGTSLNDKCSLSLVARRVDYGEVGKEYLN